MPETIGAVPIEQASVGAKIIVGTWAGTGGVNGGDPVQSLAANNLLNIPSSRGLMMQFAGNYSLSAWQGDSGSSGSISNFSSWTGPGIWAESMYWTDQLSGNSYTASIITGGGQDAYYTANANACILYGVQNIRMGWEFNDGSNGQAGPWETLASTDFVNIWRHIYGVYNAAAVAAGHASNSYFNFMWNPDKQHDPHVYTGQSVTSYYPGAAYMGNPGTVSIDLYPWVTDTWSSLQGGGSWDIDSLVTLADLHGHAYGILETSGINGTDSNSQIATFMTDEFNWASGALGSKPIFICIWADGYPTVGGGTWGLQNFGGTGAGSAWRAAATAIQGLVTAGKV